MMKRLLLPVIFAFITFGFWIIPSFKEVAAGVAIFLFGMLFLEEGFRAFTGGCSNDCSRRPPTIYGNC